MLERVAEFLRDIYSLRSQAWEEYARTLSTDVLQEELCGRQRLQRINNCLQGCELVVGVGGITLGSLSGTPWLMWGGVGLLFGGFVAHSPVDARTHTRIDLLTTELQSRLSPVDPGRLS